MSKGNDYGSCDLDSATHAINEFATHICVNWKPLARPLTGTILDAMSKGKRWKEVDEDHHCTRCGCYVDLEEISVEPHECPPGFWAEPKSPAPQPAADKVREETAELDVTLQRIVDMYSYPYKFDAKEFLNLLRAAAGHGRLASRNQTIKRVREVVEQNTVYDWTKSAAGMVAVDILLAELDRELGAGEGRDYE